MARENKRKRDERRFGKAERLADIIANDPESVFPLADADHQAIPVREIIRDCYHVDAQNVFEYAAMVHQGKDVDWRKDVPLWRLPFRRMSIEFSVDSEVGPMKHAVVMWESDPGTDGTLLITSWSFFQRRNHIFGPVGVTYVNLLGDGTLVELPTSYPPAILPDEQMVNFDSFTRYANLTAFLTVSFMNCKNVTVEPVDPPKEVNRERKKAGLKPFVRYHTINIEPMKKVLRTEGNIEANGLKKALHIVRGHFTHYSEERPLFGRPGLHGTFWTPAHTRGSIDEGIVVSDYNVKAPANP